MRALVFLMAIASMACATLSEADPLQQLEFALVNENTADRDTYDTAINGHAQPILIEFFFASCPACQANAVNVRAMASEFHGHGAQVIEVSIDDEPEEYRRWLTMYPTAFPVLNDGSRLVSSGAVGVRSYPTTVILNAAHEIVYRHVGVWSATVKARIRSLLARR